MSHPSIYRTSERLELRDLEAVLERGRGQWPELGTFRGDVIDAFFERTSLESFGDIDGLESHVGSVVIEGKLPIEHSPFADLTRVFETGAIIAEIGTLSARIGFEEAASRQRKSAYDKLGVWATAGRVELSYGANGSRVKQDPDYRRTYLERVIRTLDLPMSVVARGTSWGLEAAPDTRLSVSGGGLGGTEPSDFKVEIPDTTPAAVLASAQVFLEEFATEKRFEHTWRAQPHFDGRPQHEMTEGPQILAAAAALPADRYTIQAVVRIDSLAALETLGALCGPTDEVLSTLGSSTDANGNRLELEVRTTTAGHWLTARCRLPVASHELSKTFGARFEEALP